MNSRGLRTHATIIIVILSFCIIGMHNSSSNLQRFLEDEQQHKTNRESVIRLISWANIVIMILTHNENEANELIQAHFRTWISRVEDKGLDIVFVTDEWDTRSKQQILPDYHKVNPNIHLYKSSALHMGTKGRSKVLDSFTHVVDIFKSNKNKQFFLKMDPDNFLITGNLIEYLNVIHTSHYPLPVDFGRQICIPNGEFCFSEGGLYGMDKLGLELTLNYIKTNPDVYNYDDEGKDSIEHEDFFMSYAFFKATGTSAIEGTIIIAPEEVHTCDTNALSIHPIKLARNIYDFDNFCYDDNGNIKTDVKLGAHHD